MCVFVDCMDVLMYAWTYPPAGLIHTHIHIHTHRATAASGSSGGLPLALCDAPWQEVEEGRRSVIGVGIGDMVRTYMFIHGIDVCMYVDIDP